MRIRGRTRVRLPRRPPNTYDYVGEHVANSFLTEDLEQAWSALSPANREMVTYVIRELGERDRDSDYALIRRLSGRIRLDPLLRGRLLAYLGDRVPDGLCLWCGKELEKRPPGRAGRPAKYCCDNHRQNACRDRRRQVAAAASRSGDGF
ncbi:hypothetical protein [Nocardia asiatica]|uniref:hypothetical protein n=1 Tax=Nocardia asiatica TaxID=209252 RepID=UPI0024549AE5|nr:hypothetical protein [Nocardia asiatica]